MESCKICGRQKQTNVRPPGKRYEIDMAAFENDEEKSRFVYRLTQDIIKSKNFSDQNINRLCAIHLAKANYPDKKRFHGVIDDLKHKLNVKAEALPNSSHPEQATPAAAVKKPVKDKQTIEQCEQITAHDKHVSAQSFINLPQLLVKERSSSISSVTSYDFTSLEESERRERSRASELSDPASNADQPTGMLQTIFLKQSSPKQRTDSSDSSALALTKMVAASRQR